MTEHLRAAGGLVATVDDDATVRIGWGEPDWLGPLRLLAGAGSPRPGAAGDGELLLSAPGAAVEASVAAWPDQPVVTLRLTASVDVTGVATGAFTDVGTGWSVRPAERGDGGGPEGLVGFGLQYTEFCLPTRSDASLARWYLLPWRPAAVLPMWAVAGDGRALLLAPLDGFHEQLLAVPADRDSAADGFRWGWHGDLDAVPAGFTTTLAVVTGDDARQALDRWGEVVRERHGTRRPSGDADTLGRHLSYWTDNGAAYWYRTEPDLDMTATIAAAVADVERRVAPVGAVQLDSWFYPHETTRPLNTDEWVVPPSGLVRWEPRDDVFPDGLGPLRHAVGGRPLVTHCRHLSSASPYVEAFDCHVDGDRAHPVGADLYERWLDQAVSWGVETFEHDWLVESFLGVGGLRAGAGRARAWQEGIDRAAEERGLTLQWCMATPADFCQTVTLDRVTSIRTCSDTGYLVGPEVLWAWFLQVNAFARALGLRPFRDVFRSGEAGLAEVDALVSALSSGPVGIGDPIGAADPAVVRRACRADGVLVKPDVPLAATARTWRDDPLRRDVALVAETYNDHPAGRWWYVAALSVRADGDAFDHDVSLAEVVGAGGASGPVAVWRWRDGTVELVERWTVHLAPRDWDLRVVAPVLPAGLAVVGDPGLYATAGPQRVAGITATATGARFTVLGAGESVPVVGWAARRPASASTWTTAGRQPLAVDWDAAGSVWRITVPVGEPGWADVTIDLDAR